MPTNNMWASPYAMNPMLMNAMMFNPALQFPQVPTAPQFSLSQATAQQGPTVEAAKAQAQQPQTPELNIHEFVNAGDVVPITMQSVEKRAAKYRRSEKFGETITKEKGNATTRIDKKIESLNINRKKIELLEKRLANAKAAEKVDAKAVKELEEQLSKVQKKYDINARSLQKDLIKSRLGDLKNAKIERAFYSRLQKAFAKSPERGAKELAKLASKPKYAQLAKNFSETYAKQLKTPEFLSQTLKSGATKGLQNSEQQISQQLSAIKGLKSTGSGAKWAGRAGWAVAIGLEGYEVYKVADKHGWASKQTAKKTTSAAAGLAGAFGGAKLGALAGAKVGALIGSIFPGAGTAIGAGIGGFLGGLIGGAVGYWGAQKASDAAFDATMGKTEYKA